MAVVPDLQTITLYKIVKKMWHDNNIYDFIPTNKSFISLYTLPPAYVCIMDSVIAKLISSADLPLQLRFKIAKAFVNFEYEVLKLKEYLFKLLCKDFENDIGQYIKLIVINQDGQINYERTFAKIVVDSHFEVQFQYSEFWRYFCIDFVSFENKLWEYSDKQHLGEIDTYVEPIREWLSGVEINWGLPQKYLAAELNEENEITDSEELLIFQAIGADAPLELLQYFFNTLDRSKKSIYLCKAAFFCLRCPKRLDKIEPNKIVFFSNNMDEDYWNHVFLKYFDSIFKILIDTRYVNYCVTFVKRSGHLMNQEKGTKILTYWLENAIYTHCTEEYSYEGMKRLSIMNTFVGVWNAMPNNIKSNLGRRFDDYIWQAVDQDEFEFVRLMIFDPCFERSQIWNNLLQAHMLFIHKATNYKIQGKFMKPIPDDLMITKSENKIKAFELFLTETRYNDRKLIIKYKEISEYVFPNKEMEKSFKTNILKDEKLTVKSLLRAAYTGNEFQLNSFLMWLLDDDAPRVREFVNNRLLNDGLIYELYEKHVENALLYSFRPGVSLLNHLGIPESKAMEIKINVRQKTEYVFKLFTSLCTKLPNLHVDTVTVCLYDKYKLHMAADLIKNYLSSPSGLKHIYDMLTPDIADPELYFLVEITTKLNKFYKFKSLWLDPFNLCSSMLELLEEIEHPNVRNVPVTQYALSFESVAGYRTILDANFRLFNIVVAGNLEETDMLHILHSFEKNNLTEYSLKLADLERLWIPVVL